MPATAHLIFALWNRTGISASLQYRVRKASDLTVLVDWTGTGITEPQTNLYKASVTWDGSIDVVVDWKDNLNLTALSAYPAAPLAGYVTIPVDVDLQPDTNPSSTGGLEQSIVAFQSTKLVKSYQVKNADGSAYDLTGHGFEFVIHVRDADTVLFSATNVFALTASDNAHPALLDTVTVTLEPSVIDDSLLGKYGCELRDTTLELVLVFGTLLVKRAPLPAP